MRRKKRDRLSFAAEQLALALLFDASGGTIGKAPVSKEGQPKVEINVSFTNRRALLDSVVKLIAKRHDMSPDEEPEDGIQSMKEMLNGTGGESRDRGTGTAEATASLSDADAGND
jgi:hypothetical protein